MPNATHQTRHTVAERQRSVVAQVEAHPSGDIPYSDWIAALIDWRAVQVSIRPCDCNNWTLREVLSR